MQRIAVLSLAMLVCLAAVAQANPAAWFGPNNTYNPSVYTYNVTTAGGSLDAQIWVANDPSTDDANYLTNNGLPGIDLYVQMGAGGFAQDGSDPGPVFVSGGPHPGLDDGASSGYVINGGDPITGTIFASNHTPAGDGDTSTDQIMAVSMNTNGTPAYQGIPDLGSTGMLLATLHIIIPAGLPLGSDYPLIIDGTGSVGLPPLDFADGGNFNNFGNGVFGLYNGNIHVVPEPASVVLGLLAAVGLGIVALRRRRAA